MSAPRIMSDQPSDTQWTEFPKLYRTKTYPCEADKIVICRFRNGWVTQPMAAKNWRWWRHPGQTEPCPFDIVAWREA